MTTKRIFYAKGDKPSGYYRAGLKESDIQRVMQSGEWFAVFQVVALVVDKVPPEAIARHAQLKGINPENSYTDRSMCTGLNALVKNKLNQMARKGKVEKHGCGKGSGIKYRWIEKQNDQAGSDPA